MEQVSVFVEYFGSSPLIRIMDFLIVGKDFEYSKKEIAEGTSINKASFNRAWEKLLSNEVVVQTQVKSRVRLFKLNETNPTIKKLVQFDWEITKIETDKFLSKHVH